MWFFFEDNLIVKKRIRCQKWENCIRKRIAYNLNEIHSPRRGPSRSESLPTSVPFVVFDSIEWNRTNERSALFSNDEPFRLGLTRRRVCGKVGFFPAATASGLFGRRGLATSIAASPFIKKKQSNGLFFFPLCILLSGGLVFTRSPVPIRTPWLKNRNEIRFMRITASFFVLTVFF